MAIWLDRDHVGWLRHDGATDRFSFTYTPQWRAALRAFPISPRLGLTSDVDQSADSHNIEVRHFFGNLLPEGEALDHAAHANNISKANLVGLMIALGRETAGAVRVTLEPADPDAEAARSSSNALPATPENGESDDTLRLVTPAELSDRIQRRSEVPFSVWDRKVRLSIAGFQDKIAVYERTGKWYLVDGPRLASTVIVKPIPTRRQLAEVPGNEFLCMQLSRRCGLPTAPTRLMHVPEPILLVSRFDRLDLGNRVRRLHMIDGCQALGLSVAMRYERPYGDTREMRDRRDGVAYPKLFRLFDLSPHPMLDRQALLRWAVFQVLIGNTDAHGKNISFFLGPEGLRLAPAYDLVCVPALRTDQLSETYAMAVGDAFAESDLCADQWARFAERCGLPVRMVSRHLEALAARVAETLPEVVDVVRESGVPEAVMRSVSEVITRNCARQRSLAMELSRSKSAVHA